MTVPTEREALIQDLRDMACGGSNYNKLLHRAIAALASPPPSATPTQPAAKLGVAELKQRADKVCYYMRGAYDNEPHDLIRDLVAALAQADAAQPAGARTKITEELELIASVLRGYPPSMAQSDALRATHRVSQLLDSPIAVNNLTVKP